MGRGARVVVACLWSLTIAIPAGAGPEQDYQFHCQGCHAPDGRGAPGGAPPFRGRLRALASTPAGREYLLRVPGVTQSELDDARTAAVLNWLLRQVDGDAVPWALSPFTAAEVARWRHLPLLDVGAVRRALPGADVSADATYRVEGAGEYGSRR